VTFPSPSADLIDAISPSETRRIAERDHNVVPWSLWGSYLSERQWGTVREDYSAGTASVMGSPRARLNWQEKRRGASRIGRPPTLAFTKSS